MRPIRPPNRIVRISTAAALTALAWAGGARAQGLPSTSPEAVGVSADRLERVTASLQRYVDEGRLPGAVVLVARRGRVVLREAVGWRDVEARDPMNPDVMFRIASQTKAIVSVAAMTLVEEGALLLGDPVSRFLPEFASMTVASRTDAGDVEVVPATRPVTVRDLLTHTSGAAYGGGVAAPYWREAGIQGWYFADREEPIRETVSRMAALPFESQPGERWVYGYSTDILGAVVEVASGKPLDRLLAERVFEPLGMTDTHFYPPAAKRDRVAVVYSVGPSGLERAPDPGGMVGQGAYLDGPRVSFSAGAGLISTADDYARFLLMMAGGGELGGVRILSRKSVELMTVDHVGDLYGDGVGFGLGFSVVEDVGVRGSHGSVGEYGWGGAYHSTYWVDPAEELVVVYFTQVIPARGLDDHARLRALVYQALGDDR